MCIGNSCGVTGRCKSADMSAEATVNAVSLLEVLFSSPDIVSLFSYAKWPNKYFFTHQTVELGVCNFPFL
jgi:hypothetical protein